MSEWREQESAPRTKTNCAHSAKFGARNGPAHRINQSIFPFFIRKIKTKNRIFSLYFPDAHGKTEICFFLHHQIYFIKILHIYFRHRIDWPRFIINQTLVGLFENRVLPVCVFFVPQSRLIVLKRTISNFDRFIFRYVMPITTLEHWKSI